ncbi:MAG: hypothetical protein KBD60_12500, partial [Sterolibacterium sp.]|nr:hypothetical protein [Sterolibacterium sp.]
TASSRNSVVYVGFGNLFTSSSFPFLSDTMPAFLENEISGEAHFGGGLFYAPMGVATENGKIAR